MVQQDRMDQHQPSALVLPSRSQGFGKPPVETADLETETATNILEAIVDEVTAVQIENMVQEGVTPRSLKLQTPRSPKLQRAASCQTGKAQESNAVKPLNPLAARYSNHANLKQTCSYATSAILVPRLAGNKFSGEGTDEK